jgi:hypothetical protein
MKFKFLINDANIGFYNKCEIIEIFGFDKINKEAFNIYTLVVFENTNQNPIQELMTEKPQKFKGIKNLTWGIKRRILKIEVAEKLFNELDNKNKFCIDEPLSIGKIKLLQEQYVPPRESMHKNIQLNNILKNNFHNGSYILEFFDEEKKNIDFLLNNPVLLNGFSESVSSVLPIKIGTLSDRLGNIVFQFPINSFRLLHNSIVKRNLPKPQFEGFKVEIIPQKEDFDIKNLLLRFYEEDSDKVVARHKVIEVTNEITEIEFDNSFGTYFEVIDKSTQLLLYRCRMFIIKEMLSSISLQEHQKRVFELNGKKEKLDVSTNASHLVLGKPKEKPFNEWIANRTYEEQLNELEKSKSFVQYFGNQKDKALNDIRGLINKHGKKGIYLWDPYLSAIDIKNTLYYCKYTYVSMKAITGLKQHKNKNQVKQDMLDEFQKDKKEFLFLDLEVRGKIGVHGYDFHDRFLIFPLEKPRAWSLGISVNQLGSSHHILQEVKNAQHILNAFNKLWRELDNEECLIWKSA